MAISINYLTRVIFVPQSFLTLISGSQYSLDVNTFRLALKDLEDDLTGMAEQDTHRHNTAQLLSGVTYARSFEIINGYTVEFENGLYTVVCSGANHNIADVKVANSVSLIIGNAAGLIQVTSGSGLSTAQDTMLTRIHALLDVIEGSTDHAGAMRLLLAIAQGNAIGLPGKPSGVTSFSSMDGSKIRVAATLNGGIRTIDSRDAT